MIRYKAALEKKKNKKSDKHEDTRNQARGLEAPPKGI